MCDEYTIKDDQNQPSNLTRRGFSALAAGASVALSFPALAHPLKTIAQDIDIPTADGICDVLFVHPAEGSHPAVLIWPDILALRPSFCAMATRLAESGYAVLCINPYYRDARSPVVEVGESFGDDATRNKIYPLYQTLSPQTNVRDARAFVDWIDTQSAVDKSRPIGTMGYCMGGPMVMRAAAERADRIGAACAYHPVSLATEGEDSPHLLIPKINAECLIALAENDDEKHPDDKHVLRQAFTANELSAEFTVFDGALHGWCVLDSRVYNEAQAEVAWSKTLALFDRAL